jgi:hypothetical protein
VRLQPDRQQHRTKRWGKFKNLSPHVPLFYFSTFFTFFHISYLSLSLSLSTNSGPIPNPVDI